ncbi:uncharacterized protein [Rutidosis leptorrhynchoides]|uniref:uncharacterized protein n=1 Tax=Rutidosis leptorrhynchoides TaxID=125765 RepID=UPI003A990677
MIKCNFNFCESFKLYIGDSSTFKFWDDLWLGDKCFKDRFNRLYRLKTDKDALVRDRITWNGSNWVGHWNWIRELNGRVLDDINRLAGELSALPFSSDGVDKWVWNCSNDNVFKTKILASLFDDKLLPTSDDVKERNNFIPQSLNIFAWWVKRKRIPVRVELDKWGIDLDNVRCPMCNDDTESIEHVMIFCRHAIDAWDRVYKWWGLGSFSNWSLNEILNGDGCGAQSSIGKKLWQSIEWVCGYLIWKNRNKKVFRNRIWSGPNLLSEIQIKSYEWIARRAKNLNIEWHQWLINPRFYLDNASLISGIG